MEFKKKQAIKILVVDDYPMTVQGYSILLKNTESEFEIETDSAFSCDDVLMRLNDNSGSFYDIVLLDINLPPSNDKKVINGQDLGLKIKHKFPQSKIIVHTGINDQDRIANIFSTLKPEGFLIKPDIEPEILFDAIRAVLSDESYYSKKINKFLGKKSNQDFFLDSLDVKILYHLSRGERMKNLPNHVPLSMSTIERRKKNLKLLFGIPDGSTKELLEIVREKGFI